MRTFVYVLLIKICLVYKANSAGKRALEILYTKWMEKPRQKSLQR